MRNCCTGPASTQVCGVNIVKLLLHMRVDNSRPGTYIHISLARLSPSGMPLTRSYLRSHIPIYIPSILIPKNTYIHPPRINTPRNHRRTTRPRTTWIGPSARARASTELLLHQAKPHDQAIDLKPGVLDGDPSTEATRHMCGSYVWITYQRHMLGRDCALRRGLDTARHGLVYECLR